MQKPDTATMGRTDAVQPVAIRPVQESDCTATYLGWLHDPRVHRYLETRHQEQTLDSIRSFVRAMRSDPRQHLFAILCDGRHVGNLKLGPVDARHGCADLSYFLGDVASWGRGIASQAIALALEHGFGALGLHRIQAGVYAGNQASIRVLTRLGFRHEGTWREQLLGPEGREDHLWFGLLRAEWRDRSPSAPATCSNTTITSAGKEQP